MVRRAPSIPNARGPSKCEQSMRQHSATRYRSMPFCKKVAKGIYPPPKKQDGCPDKWHRAKLEADIGRRHGLPSENGPLVEDLGNLVG